MPKIDRNDDPNRRHHVGGRGLNRRELFLNPAAVKSYLTLLNNEVEKELIQVLAYCFMDNHFHLIVESLTGELHKSIGRVNNCFAKIYNQGAGRKGTLFDGRFYSRPLMDDADLLVAVRYVEANPVAAKLCVHPADHAFTSARAWRDHIFPDCLDTSWYTSQFVPAGTSFEESRSLYLRLVGGSMTETEREDIDRLGYRSASLNRGPGIIHSGQTAEWLRKQNVLADGADYRFVRRTAQEVINTIEVHRHQLEQLAMHSSRRIPPEEIAWVGLLHEFAGMSYKELGEMMGLSTTAVFHRMECYRKEVAANREYSHWLQCVCAQLQLSRP